jgi:hypothetical protein
MGHPVSRYLPLLIEGDQRGLRELFAGQPRVNDPHLGWVEDAAFDLFVENSHLGLAERRATVEHLGTTATPSGATAECLLTLTLVRTGNTVLLPVAIASDTALDARLDSLRIYHSMRPLLGFSLVRAPVLPTVATLVLPGAVARYHDCLTRGDLPGILEQFAPEGELRESSGPLQVHRGVLELTRFFTVLFSNGGGLGLEHCAMNEEGRSCAVEYVVTTWGRSPLPHQAAAAVYERADTGLLSEVRLYDDIEHPLQRN